MEDLMEDYNVFMDIGYSFMREKKLSEAME